MMRLHLLGVNGPFPESGGATSGYLLEAGDSLFQFDLGSGVLAALTAKAAPEELTALLLTHWHFDHAADIGVLEYRLEALGKTMPVYGPADPDSPLYRLVCEKPCFEFHVVTAGDVFSLAGKEIRVNAALHPVPAVGYTLTFEGKTFGYTGDTKPLPSLAADYRGCALLLADAPFPRDVWNENRPIQSAEQAARLAAETGAGSLVITHINPLFPRRTILEEARAVFLRTQLAEAGAVIDL